MNSRTLLFLIPLLLWVSVVFHFSSQPYQKQSIVPFLNQHLSKSALSRLLPDVKFHYGKTQFDAQKYPFQFVEFVFRKTAHLFIYFVLGMCGYFAMVPYRLPDRWRMVSAFLMVVAAAGLDEWNQTFRDSRTGQIRDVGIDAVGGALGILLCMFLWYLVRNRSKNRTVIKIARI